MATATETTLSVRRVGDGAEISLRPISVDDYHRMIDAGIFDDENGCVELLEGLLVVRSPQKPAHAAAVTLFAEAFRSFIPHTWHVRVQLPVTIGESEPEPDIVVVQAPPRQFTDRHPGPNEIVLIAQIARTSLLEDRNLRGRVFAAVGVPVYWIVNLAQSQVEVYVQPEIVPAGAPAYAHRTDYRAPASIPLILADQQLGAVPVADLLP